MGMSGVLRGLPVTALPTAWNVRLTSLGICVGWYRYPDTPGAYPASKTSWYWDNGGLYDQAHEPGYTTTASYTARNGQANLMQAGMM